MNFTLDTWTGIGVVITSLASGVVMIVKALRAKDDRIAHKGESGSHAYDILLELEKLKLLIFDVRDKVDRLINKLQDNNASGKRE